jgi:hypothetical protein
VILAGLAVVAGFFGTPAWPWFVHGLVAAAIVAERWIYGRARPGQRGKRILWKQPNRPSLPACGEIFCGRVLRRHRRALMPRLRVFRLA